MIYIGLDDTDTRDTAGTNQLARRIAGSLPPGFGLRVVLRHQLLDDPRVPYTSHNGSASIAVVTKPGATAADLLPMLQQQMTTWYVPGSDPGLCVVTGNVPRAVQQFGRRCQRELVSQRDARALAAGHGLYLSDFGGTGDGVIGALAAVGLLASGDDGRVVHLPGWTWPDSFCGHHAVGALLRRGVHEIRDRRSVRRVTEGVVDIGRHLRPAYRNRRVVLFVEPATTTGSASEPSPVTWKAMKLP